MNISAGKNAFLTLMIFTVFVFNCFTANDASAFHYLTTQSDSGRYTISYDWVDGANPYLDMTFKNNSTAYDSGLSMFEWAFPLTYGLTNRTEHGNWTGIQKSLGDIFVV